MTIKIKKLKNKCYNCNGTGKIKKKKCPTCNDTGIWEDEIYYYINNKKKIAIDSDTLK